MSAEAADIAADTLGNPIRELADRLAEEAARAAEYRVRLELTEQAQSSLEEELAMERVRRVQAELERDELRRMLDASSEPTGAPEMAGRSRTVPNPRCHRSPWRDPRGGVSSSGPSE